MALEIHAQKQGSILEVDEYMERKYLQAAKVEQCIKQRKSKSKAAAYCNVLFCNLTKFYKTIACKSYAQSFMPFPQHGMGPKSRPKKASKTSLRKLHKICFSTRIPGKMQNLRRLSKVGNIQYIRMDQVIFDNPPQYLITRM